MRYHDITKNDMVNGDGLRVVLWVSGCSHKCAGCQNPITWDANCGLMFDQKAEKEVFDELEKDYISGITFSGGDPLFIANREAVGNLIKKIRAKFPQKSIWLYTGYNWEEIKDLDFIPLIDVLIDGKFIQRLLDNKLHWVGSSNQRVIDVKSTIKTGEIKIHP